jgi:hypothetical protein
MFDANNKAVDYLYRSLCGPELEWVRTENAHAGNAQVQARFGSGATSVAKNPMLLNGCYRWFWSLQRLYGLVATERSSIATSVVGCCRWHRLLPCYLTWLLKIGPALPHYWFFCCHHHLFLVARDGLSIATIIVPIATTKCGCYMCDCCNPICFDFHNILQHQVNILIIYVATLFFGSLNQ